MEGKVYVTFTATKNNSVRPSKSGSRVSCSIGAFPKWNVNSANSGNLEQLSTLVNCLEVECEAVQECSLIIVRPAPHQSKKSSIILYSHCLRALNSATNWKQ